MRRRWRRPAWSAHVRRPLQAAAQSMLDDFVAALLPAACVHCGRVLDGDRRVASSSRLVSGALRRPLGGSLTLPLRLLCEGCVAGVRPAAQVLLAEHSGRLLSTFEPTAALFALVHAFKYGGMVELAGWFGARLARVARRELGASAAVLVPVPLHPARERERGFNQSALLARDVGRRIGIPVHEALLARRLATPPLARLPHAARRVQVQGAFARLSPLPPAVRIVLVDDVVTTGATTAAASAALGVPPARLAVLCLCVAHGASAPTAAEPGL